MSAAESRDAAVKSLVVTGYGQGSFTAMISARPDFAGGRPVSQLNCGS